ncbi:fungal-specific transcription factor domain-containing protein [Phyllosticta capitalensis]
MRRHTPLKTIHGGNRKAQDESSRERKRKCTPTALVNAIASLKHSLGLYTVYKTECHYGGDPKSSTKRTPDVEEAGRPNTPSDSISKLVASVKALPGSQAARLIKQIQCCEDIDALANSASTLPFTVAEHQAESPAEMASSPRPNARLHYGNTSIFSLQGEIPGFHAKSAQEPRMLPDEGVIWTSAPIDLVDHLLELYFSRVHPFHPVGSQRAFYKAFEEKDLNSCSPLLVNAILAFSCHYSDRLDVRTDPADARTTGDQFFAEARRLLNNENSPSIPTIQALAIMSLREISKGRDSSGYRYIRWCMTMIIEMGLHLSVSGEQTHKTPWDQNVERTYIFWGCYALDVVWALCTGRTPSIPNFAITVGKDGLKSHDEGPRGWQNRTRASPGRDTPFSQVPEILHYLSGFYEITSGMLNIVFARGGQFTTDTVLHCYAKYQSWYHGLPDKLHAENLHFAKAHSILPPILLLNMVYHNCIFHLFRLSTESSFWGLEIRPHEMCRKSARNITQLMKIYRKASNIDSCPPLVAHVLFWSSVQHLQDLPDPQAVQGLREGIQDLDAMTFVHPIAAQCITILREYSRHINKKLPDVVSPTDSRAATQDERDELFPGRSDAQGSLPRGGNDTQHSSGSGHGNITPITDATHPGSRGHQSSFPGVSGQSFRPGPYYSTFPQTTSQTETPWTLLDPWHASNPKMQSSSIGVENPNSNSSFDGVHRPSFWQNPPNTGPSPSGSGFAAGYANPNLGAFPLSQDAGEIFPSSAAASANMNLMSLGHHSSIPGHQPHQDHWENRGRLDTRGEGSQRIQQGQVPVYFAGSVAQHSPVAMGMQGQGEMDYEANRLRGWFPHGQG